MCFDAFLLFGLPVVFMASSDKKAGFYRILVSVL